MEIMEAAQEECPVSIISRHPQMIGLVEEIHSAGIVKASTGAYPYGMDASEWPARWYDAVMLEKMEESLVSSTKDEFVQRFS